MPTAIAINRRKPAPLHRQIYEEWRRGILSGRFAPGDRVPSTRELSAALQVSRATVAAAYDQLVAEGYLDGRHGSGTFVSRQLPERDAWSGGAAVTRAEHAAIRLSAFVDRLSAITAQTPAAPGVIDLSGSGPDYDSSRLPPGAGCCGATFGA